MKFITAILIFQLVQIFPAKGQNKVTQRYSSGEWLCRQTMYLDSTGLFFHEWGCEGRSHISFGKFKIGADKKISFQYLPFDSIKPISRIEEEPSLSGVDSISSVTFFDRYGDALGIMFNVLLEDTSGRVSNVMTDQDGKIEFNRLKYKSVALSAFWEIYGKVEAIPLADKPLKIHLSLPGDFVMYTEILLDKHRKLNLKQTKAGLYNYKTKKLLYAVL